MKTLEIDMVNVSGIAVRTTNENEMKPSTARIANLWQKFYADVMPKLPEGAKIYGVYTNYQSDYMGEFDVIACSDAFQPDQLPDSIQTKIQSGKYLVFTAEGEMPQIVIDLWGKIWTYFQSDNCSYQRAYTTDFEYYKSENEIEIYIALR